MIEGKIAVFLCFANNYSTSEEILLTLETEEREIDDALDGLRNSGKCHVERGRGLTPDLLFEKLQKHRGEIDILHFSGHADENELHLEGQDSDGNAISLQSYIDLIKNQAGNIKLLFLSACKTYHQAKTLCGVGVKVAICTTDEVDEDDGQVFTRKFYDALSLGASIKEAFTEAKGYLKTFTSAAGNENAPDKWELVCSDKKYCDWKPFAKRINVNSLNLLQLSDVNNSKYDFSSLEEFTSSSKYDIDIILCTGNITSSPSELNSLKEDHSKLVSELERVTGVSQNNIFFSPGQNDLDYARIFDAVHNKINTITTNDDIADFINSGEQFTQSCNASSNFRSVVEARYGNSQVDIFSSLYSTHIREIAQKKVGIVCINSWWSYEEKVGGSVFPIDILEQAYEKISASDYKILACNSDLSDLKPFNKKEIENFVYSSFDFLMLGAVANGRNSEFPLISNEGIFQCYSGKNRSTGIDFIFHSFDFIKNQVESHVSIINEVDGLLIEEHDTQLYSFPRGTEKRKQVKLLQVINKRLDEYDRLGDSLFVDYKRQNKSFTDLFTQPIIREKPVEEIEAISKNSLYIHNQYNTLFEHKKSFMLIGKDKSGKSSLLIHLAIKMLEKFTSDRVVPIYIDLKNYKNKIDKLDFVNFLSSFVERNKRETIGLFEKYSFKLLLDNFDPSNSELVRKIKLFLEEYPTFTYILSTDQTVVRSYENFDFGFNHYKKLYIHEVSRTEIRSLATKCLDGTDRYIEDVVQRLINLFRQYRMPFNYWTISVFLWILSKRKLEEFEIQNNSELIELYIQELIGQKELAYDTTNRFSFKKYKRFLSFLAWKLYKKHSPDNYSTEYEILLKYAKEFIGRSRRNVATPKDVIEYILDRGVLKKVSSKNYSFRLNGAFEYFLAIEMRENEEFLKEVLEDDNIYVSFKNELDLYSGFSKDDRTKDRTLLTRVYEKTVKKFAIHNERLKKEGSTDENLVSKGGGAILSLIHELDVEEVAPLSYEEKDIIETEIEDNKNSILPIEDFNTDVKVKKQYDETSNELEELEDYLFIMSRVFRNVDVDDIVEEALDDDIFSFILDSTCNLGFLLLEEIADTLEDAHDTDFNNKFGMPSIILKLMGNFLPFIVQGNFYHSVGHVTLENVILTKVEDLEKDSKNNQFKLFVLYFTLMDLDTKHIRKYLDSIFEIINIGILKSSLLTKVLYYLIFRAYKNISLTKFLKSKFRSYQMKINPKTDTRLLEKQISEIDKAVLLKRSSENDDILPI